MCSLALYIRLALWLFTGNKEEKDEREETEEEERVVTDL
jgi:hypothetical protein